MGFPTALFVHGDASVQSSNLEQTRRLLAAGGSGYPLDCSRGAVCFALDLETVASTVRLGQETTLVVAIEVFQAASLPLGHSRSLHVVQYRCVVVVDGYDALAHCGHARSGDYR